VRSRLRTNLVVKACSKGLPAINTVLYAEFVGEPLYASRLSPITMTEVVRDAAGVEIHATYTFSRFEDFYNQESSTLFRRLCLITGNRHEAEDVMQDAFLRIYERWDRVGDMDDPVGYLYRTAFNVFRRRSRRAALALRRTLRLAPSTDDFAAVDAKHVVSQALAGLTSRQRAALVLTEVLGYTSEEAGRLLGVRAGTVRALASQGRAAMRNALGDAP
jgi:RNA polymerase sigma-70 factor (ECF subfamily)